MKQILVGLSLKIAETQLGGGALDWQVQDDSSAAAVDASNITFQAVTLRYCDTETEIAIRFTRGEKWGSLFLPKTDKH